MATVLMVRRIGRPYLGFFINQAKFEEKGGMNIRPLHDRVVIKRLEEEQTTAGGIVIPDTAAEKPQRGEVLAVGRGKPLDNGEVRAPEVKTGDKVMFGKFSGTEVKVDDEEVVVMREDDILAVLG
jgi:chaperonin GroES